MSVWLLSGSNVSTTSSGWKVAEEDDELSDEEEFGRKDESVESDEESVGWKAEEDGVEMGVGGRDGEADVPRVLSNSSSATSDPSPLPSGPSNTSFSEDDGWGRAGMEVDEVG